LSTSALDPIYFRKGLYNNEYSDFQIYIYSVTEVLQETVVPVVKKGSQFSQKLIPPTPRQENISYSVFNTPRSISVLQTSYERSTSVPQTSYERSTSISQTSYESTNVPQTYYDLLCDTAREKEEQFVEQPQTNMELEIEVQREIQMYKNYVLAQTEILTYQVKNKTWDLPNWWKNHVLQFKYLSETVKAILCTSASSTNCERCFFKPYKFNYQTTQHINS